MRRAILCMSVTFLILWCAMAFSIEPVGVILDHAFSNASKGVLVAYLRSRNTKYTVTCNEDTPKCVFPSKSVEYYMADSKEKPYQCQNVALWKARVEKGLVYPDGDEPIGIYCLREIE